ncbi:MAG TPA: tyrosine--tRNA ligase [Aestuariivirga sp.]|nr:tyrosine--tRNA ligase [Aestuariivirga sp.]
MSTYKSDFLNTLSTRGYIHQCSDATGLDELAAKGDVTAYIGFDCTAKSLHVGSLVQIMLLYWAQQTGQKSIALMGGGTTRVGDPSGRDESRKLLTLEDIEDNKRGIQQVFSKFLRFGSGAKDALMIDNAEWLTKLNYLDMLREIGRHFSVNRMLAMDSVKLRLEREHELTFIEFNYMVLQAYDYTELARRYGCNLQMGGSDQWGNIINGIDLGRRMGTHQLFALTTPLITLASGAKMGKTASGAVWLNADMLSPYGYWQFWRNAEDADVGRFLKLFTTLPLSEIERLEKLGGSEINDAKKILAVEATALLHGRKAAEDSAEVARKTFEGGESAEGLPTIKLDLVKGVGVLQAAVLAGFATSNSEARRAIHGGAIRINDIQVSDDRFVLDNRIRAGKESIKFSMGKKKHVLIKPL